MIAEIAVSLLAIVGALILILAGIQEYERGWKFDGTVAFFGATVVVFLGVLPWI